MTLRTTMIAGALLCLPMAAIAQKTSYDFDKTANFQAFKTYGLKDGTKVGNPLIDDRITLAIEAQLAAKGLTPSDASPDVTAIYHIAFEKQQDISAWSTGGGPYGYRWGGGWGTTDVRVTEILVGTLVIDIIDARKGELVWRGIGEKEVDTRANPERRDKNIAQAVEKIFRNYPPKARK